MPNDPSKPDQSSARPRLQGKADPTCPILLEARAALENGQSLHRALRKLRRSTQRCTTCPQVAECPAVQTIVHALSEAIREVRMEWGESAEEL